MAKDSRLNILIEARDKSKGAFTSAERNVNSLQEATGNVSGSLAGLTKAATLAGIALGAMRLTQTAFELGQAAAQGDRLSRSFEQLSQAAGQNSTAMLSAMRRAADGTISDSDLVASANRAMLLGVADSAEEMTQLLEVASARGKAMGLSTAQAFSDLVTGIGRQSSMILDNLGIVTGGEQVFDDYAESIGRTADSLTDAEKKQALLNKVVAESQTMIDASAEAGRDMAASFERMDASLQNAKSALGALFSPAAAIVAEKIAEAAEQATKAMQEMPVIDAERTLFSAGDSLTSVAAELDRQITAMQQAGIAGDVSAMQEAVTKIDMLRIAVAALGEEYNKAAATTGAPLLDLGLLSVGVVAFEDLAEAEARAAYEAERAAQAEDKLARAAAIAAEEQRKLRDAIRDAVQELRDIQSVASSAASSLRSSFLGIADTIGGTAALAGYQEARRQLDGQIEIYQALGLGAEEIEFRIQGMVEGVRDTNKELEKTLTSTDGISKSASDAERAFDNLRSKVEGVLSGSLSSGIDLDDVLPRQDAIEEDARRLADVAVNGFASPWASYLNDKFPELFNGAFEGGGDIKGIAAGILRDFEDGLRPELLDKEKAKERIRRILTGEANLRELATEITQELSQEMQGVSLGDIRSAVGQALGTNDGSNESGAAFGDGFLTGVTGTNAGMKAVGALIDQIKNQATLVKTAGGNTGRIWGDGFMETVGEAIPPALIEILVRLTTPGVFSLLQQYGTLTGTAD